jgi:prefoldin alpha subunit
MEKDSENELIIKLSIFEQQIKQIQQQLEIIERNILDMNSLEIGLDEFREGEGKEVLSQIGKNIFAKTKLISDELIVNIGDGNLVKKSIEDTKKLIGEQTKKLERIRDELNSALEEINKEMSRMMFESQGKKD